MAEPTRINSLEDCYRLADQRSDTGDDEARHAINFAAWLAVQNAKWAERLAWACLEKSAAKRRAAVALVRAEMDANNLSTAKLPSSWSLQPAAA